METRKTLGLYIHIPFCESKCAYCDFYSICDSERREHYVNALCAHIASCAEIAADRSVDSVYLGGGTPCLLEPTQIERICRTITLNYHLSDSAEITMEANPSSFTAEKMRAAKECGINRVSLGLQSAIDGELRALSRRHDFAGFVESYEMLRAVGFDNVSVDLMYGIPHQSPDSLICSIDALAALSPEHISLYGLKVEENTPFGRMGAALKLPDEDTQCDMYTSAVDRLSERGYHRYEISNFAKEGRESRHNLRYWQGEEFLGFGPAAYSYFGGKRYGIPRDIDGYIEKIVQGESPETIDVVEIGEKEAQTERIMLGLRLERGIVPDDRTLAAAKRYVDGGFMEASNGRLRFTTKGYLVSNTILADILDI